MEPLTVTTLLVTWGYPALLLLLVLTGMGSPIPEDLLLVAAGYLVFADVLSWPAVLAVSLAGVVMSDLLLYSAGRHIAWRSARRPDSRLLSRERLDRATRWFQRVGDRLVLIARLVPGTRAMVFVTAGVHGVPVDRFLRHDLIGAAFWVPAMLAVGYASGSRLGSLGEVIARLEHGTVWVMAAAVVILVLWLSWGREESKL